MGGAQRRARWRRLIRAASRRAATKPTGWLMADETCPNCGGEGWVCENHPDRPWPSGCQCGGAGEPCRFCNPNTPDAPPRLPPDFEADDG